MHYFARVTAAILLLPRCNTQVIAPGSTPSVGPGLTPSFSPGVALCLTFACISQPPSPPRPPPAISTINLTTVDASAYLTIVRNNAQEILGNKNFVVKQSYTLSEPCQGYTAPPPPYEARERRLQSLPGIPGILSPPALPRISRIPPSWMFLQPPPSPYPTPPLPCLEREYQENTLTYYTESILNGDVVLVYDLQSTWTVHGARHAINTRARMRMSTSFTRCGLAVQTSQS